jgi:predicted RNA-binding Zn-ribbon protein involved in translation (DUF1610 family)
MASFKFKNDKFKKARGGYSRLLAIHCASCEKSIALYQKDGSGSLKRMYIDRISGLDIKPQKKGDFTCPSCGKTLGTFFIYAKEQRPAIRLYKESIYKKIAKKP